MIREFFAPRVFFVFLVLWAIAWGATLFYIRTAKSERRRFVRHATAPFISGVATLCVVFIFLAALTYFN